MSAYVYPTAIELKAIEQEKLPVLTMDDPLFSPGIMTIEEVDSDVLAWEQEDNYTGLQQLRGMNGQPGRVNKVGAKRYLMEPGVYGEFMTVDEKEITSRRPYGTFGGPINIDDLVARRQDQLLSRRIDRIRYIGWSLLAAGTFSVSNAEGIVEHTDTYTLQTYDASTWATATTATPLLDFRTMQLKDRGKGCSFGGQAKAFMSRGTFNYMIANTNAADLYGKRTSGLATVMGLKDVNSVLAAEDLPEIVVYDKGYLDDNAAFQLFLPINKVVVIGYRPGGVRIMDYAMTRNANNPSGAPGSYTKVVDKGENEVPRTIDVHDGHNGGPRMYYPSAVVIMDVS